MAMNSGMKRPKPPKPPKPPRPPLTDAEKKKLAYLKKQQELAKGRGKKSPVPGTTTLVKVPGKKYMPRTPVKTPKPGDGMKYIPRTPGKK